MKNIDEFIDKIKQDFKEALDIMFDRPLYSEGELDDTDTMATSNPPTPYAVE